MVLTTEIIFYNITHLHQNTLVTLQNITVLIHKMFDKGQKLSITCNCFSSEKYVSNVFMYFKLVNRHAYLQLVFIKVLITNIFVTSYMKFTAYLFAS